MAAIPPGTDLNLIPAGVPPAGVIPAIGGGPTLGTATIVLESVMMFFAVVTVSGRMTASWYSRRDPAGGISLADCKYSNALSESLFLQREQYR